MRVNKAGERSIKLHDADVIMFVEELAKDMDCTLYEAVESIISDRISDDLNEDVPPIHYDAVGFMIDVSDIRTISKIFIDNGYAISLTPIENEKVIVKITERAKK